jgi:hypothetical protein
MNSGSNWFVFVTLVGILPLSIGVAGATIPPATDIPEEILRTEVITEARSPIDGKPLSAAEFTELTIQIQENRERDAGVSATQNSKFKEIIFLLRLRGFLRSVGIPIK